VGEEGVEGSVLLLGSDLEDLKDIYLVRFFLDQPDPKEGYSVTNCQNLRMRRVIQFLTLILYLEKPTRMSTTIGRP
jgi:hypothetical protein